MYHFIKEKVKLRYLVKAANWKENIKYFKFFETLFKSGRREEINIPSSTC
jgi:hypothetical protein